MTKGWKIAIAGAVFVIGWQVCVVAYRGMHETDKEIAEGRLVQLEESARRWETPKVFPSGFKLQVEHPLNTDFLVYHVSTRVTSEIIEDQMVGTESSNRELLRDLHEVTGVGKAYLRPYQVVVEKGQVFDWYEMQPALETVIRQHLEPRIPAQQ